MPIALERLTESKVLRHPNGGGLRLFPEGPQGWKLPFPFLSWPRRSSVPTTPFVDDAGTESSVRVPHHRLKNPVFHDSLQPSRYDDRSTCRMKRKPWRRGAL
jgi:hypothetical protein